MESLFLNLLQIP